MANQIAKIAKTAQEFTVKNSPVILTALAVGGFVSTVVLAVKATPEAHRKLVLEDSYRSEAENSDSKYQYKDIFNDPVGIIKLTWKEYIPTAVVGSLSIACIIGAQSINHRRQAALATAYTLVENGYREYREKVTQHIGESKEQKVRDEIVKDKLEADPVKSKEVIITSGGDILCYDTLSGRYFNSSVQAIEKAQNEINLKCINEMYASHNDFYRLVGLPLVALGEELGWRTDHKMELEFTSDLASDGRPCLAINYQVAPIRGYYKFGY